MIMYTNIVKIARFKVTQKMIVILFILIFFLKSERKNKRRRIALQKEWRRTIPNY